MNSNNRDLKRNWKAQQRQSSKASFPVSDELLQSLFGFVEDEVEKHGCDHSSRYTLQWIAVHQQPENTLIEWLQKHGGYCDCEVVANSADHWEQNR